MYPIILAHGIARFDILREKIKVDLNLPDNPLNDELHYFKNIKSHLTSKTFFNVFTTNVDFAGSLELRADQLKTHVLNILAQTGAEKVHIIAHSMGGLDARKIIVELDMADKIASLTTIGTPHFGTSIANRLMGLGGNLFIKFVKKAVNKNLEGFADLTTVACLEFNKRSENFEAKNDVVYQTYSSFETAKDIFLPLLPSWIYIHLIEGRNDGLVPVSSQKWKTELVADDGTKKTIIQKEFPLPADHLNQVGWWDAEETVISFSGTDVNVQRRDYESKIKGIYLSIAKDLQVFENANSN